MKKVVIACGSGIATSTLAAHKFQSMCNENNIQVEIVQCSYGEVDAFLAGADLLLTTQKYSQSFDIPTEVCLAYITGIQEDELNERLLKILKDE
jgi:PTS system galactitol-specific IIB component